MARTRKASKQTLLTLGILLENSRKWRHGYDISKEARLKSGTLYPILMRLSDRGMLESKWQPSQQDSLPPRHMYRLTTSGIKYAREQLENSGDLELSGKTLGSHA